MPRYSVLRSTSVGATATADQEQGDPHTRRVLFEVDPGETPEFIVCRVAIFPQITPRQPTSGAFFPEQFFSESRTLLHSPSARRASLSQSRASLSQILCRVLVASSHRQQIRTVENQHKIMQAITKREGLGAGGRKCEKPLFHRHFCDFSRRRTRRFSTYTLNWLPALIASQNTATQCKGAPTISGGLR